MSTRHHPSHISASIMSRMTSRTRGGEAFKPSSARRLNRRPTLYRISSPTPDTPFVNLTP